MNIKKIFILMIFIFSIASAKNKPYQISIIVFKHITTQSLQSEKWTNEAKIPSLKDAIYLQSASDNNFPVLLPNHRFGLKRELKKLQMSNEYQILTYFSWSQDFNQEAPWIHVTGGQTFDQSSDDASNRYELNGKIKVALNVYFNLYARLYLIEPESVVGNLDDKNNSIYFFSMNQNRHLKLNEVNYLDHPLFGMLIKINPE